jgi:hypothetical protein
MGQANTKDKPVKHFHDYQGRQYLDATTSVRFYFESIFVVSNLQALNVDKNVEIFTVMPMRCDYGGINHLPRMGELVHFTNGYTGTICGCSAVPCIELEDRRDAKLNTAVMIRDITQK